MNELPGAGGGIKCPLLGETSWGRHDLHEPLPFRVIGSLRDAAEETDDQPPRDRNRAHAVLAERVPFALRQRDRDEREQFLLLPSRVWPLRTIFGSKQPLRSRGTAKSTAPTSVNSVLPVVPLRLFPLARPARAEAVQPARDIDPDVVVMDIRMPGMDGIDGPIWSQLGGSSSAE
jgi:hypothetical protein